MLWVRSESVFLMQYDHWSRSKPIIVLQAPPIPSTWLNLVFYWWIVVAIFCIVDISAISRPSMRTHGLCNAFVTTQSVIYPSWSVTCSSLWENAWNIQEALRTGPCLFNTDWVQLRTIVSFPVAGLSYIFYGMIEPRPIMILDVAHPPF